MAPECIYCGDQLWSARERCGVCCSCQGLALDELGDEDEDDPFCPTCGGPCDGLGAFVEDAGPRTMVKESDGR